MIYTYLRTYYIYINPPLFFRLLGRFRLKVQKHRVLVSTSFFHLQLQGYFFKGLRKGSFLLTRPLRNYSQLVPATRPPPPDWIQFRRHPENRAPKG